MKNKVKLSLMFFIIAITMVSICACTNNGSKDCKTAESVTLEKVVLNEVEFENGEAVKLEQNCDEIQITGTIDAMTDAQKSAFGVEGVDHMVALKVVFDKERTLASVKIKGNKTKVYSTNSEDENYAGSLTDLLDNETGEDAYAGMVLDAKTKEYVITAKYTDAKESVLTIKINATLATAESE